MQASLPAPGAPTASESNTTLPTQGRDAPVNLPQFARGVREFYFGMLNGRLAPADVDRLRAVDSGWLARAILESQPNHVPQAPILAVTLSELEAFNRFCDCAEDNEGYDVDKEMMRRLSEIGLVRSTGFGRYMTTSYGDAVRSQGRGA